MPGHPISSIPMLSSIGSLLQSMRCVLIRLSADLAIQDFNSEAEIIYGCSKKTALAKQYVQFCRSIHVDPPLLDFSSVLNGKTIEGLVQEIAVRRSTKHIQWTIIPLVETENLNKITSILLVGADIGLHQHVKNLEQKVEFFENIINHVPQFLFWKNKESVFMGCNERFAKTAGLKSAADIVGKTDYDLPWSKYESDAYRADDRRVIESGKGRYDVEESQTINGKQTYLLTSKVPLYSSNNSKEVIGVLCIYNDLTERKQMEQALLKAKESAEIASRAKTEFLENMRHDIRTPLTGIVGFANIMKEEVESPRIKEYADNLVASSHALLDLLNEVLEAIKVSSGEIPVLRKKFDLSKKLQEVINLNRAKAQHKKIDLLFYYDKKVPTYFIGDPVRIHRIVLELVANALNFTEQGQVKLSVRLLKRNKRDVVVELAVEDTGVGMEPDKQQELFVQFKRLTPSYSGIYKGAGLGLAIINKFVEELQGEIYVDSELKKGTKFTCLIPLTESLLNDGSGCDTQVSEEVDKKYEVTFADEVRLAANSLSVKGQYYILLVEDQTLAAKIAKIVLSNLGCHVDVASDGKMGYEFYLKNRYDLILLDIGLPDFDGFELTRKIRQQESASKSHVPIVALTAHIGTENKQRCIEAGMNAVLTKPLVREKAKDMLDVFIPTRSHQLGEGKREEELEWNELSQVSGKVVDVDLATRLLGKKEFVDEMLNMFAKELAEETKKINTALKQKNWEAIVSLTHKIKGGASYCGATRLKEACNQLMAYLKLGATESRVQLVHQMIDEIQALGAFVKDNFS